jgi:hypothetical protein
LEVAGVHRIFSSFDARSRRWLRIFAIGAALLWLNGTCDKAHAQDDGSRIVTDGGGQEILESVFVPPIAHAGRIYQERWLLTPKGSDIPSLMNWIRIADPNAHTLYQCNAFRHVCELLTYNGSANVHYQPSLFKSGYTVVDHRRATPTK